MEEGIGKMSKKREDLVVKSVAKGSVFSLSESLPISTPQKNCGLWKTFRVSELLADDPAREMTSVDTRCYAPQGPRSDARHLD